jgi:methylenetetrahydrofolate dehydrogenase (NADP+)/methenyltetrahydrofolate cyclohydrolase
MQIIDGRALAQTIRDHIKTKGVQAKLGVLLVGNDPASQLYVNLKEKAAHEVGIETDIRHLPAFTPDEELKELIASWNADPKINGILIQLPLPEGHDTDALIATMDPAKDVDGFHPKNIEALYAGNATMISPVHEGILRMIASTGISMNTTKATIIANSDIFSKPLEYLLRKAGAFVTILKPDELERKILLTSNIIIVAVGHAKLLNASHISPNTVVIDVGTNRTADGKTVGDVDAEDVKNIPGWLSPVPGGVGPMTIALLLKNVATAQSLHSSAHGHADGA